MSRVKTAIELAEEAARLAGLEAKTGAKAALREIDEVAEGAAIKKVKSAAADIPSTRPHVEAPPASRPHVNAAETVPARAQAPETLYSPKAAVDSDVPNSGLFDNSPKRGFQQQQQGPSQQWQPMKQQQQMQGPKDPEKARFRREADGTQTPLNDAAREQKAAYEAAEAAKAGKVETPNRGAETPPPTDPATPPPPQNNNGTMGLSPETVDRQKKWEVQGMVMTRLGSIESDFLELQRGTRLSLERINNLENSLNVGGQFSKNATRVKSLDELIERVNIAEQKRVKASGLDNFFQQTPQTKIHPDDFKKFIREGSMGALPPIPGVSGPLGSAASNVKGQNLNADGVRALKEKLTDTGRINDLLDPKDFKDIKTPSELDRYFRENPGNAVPGEIFDKIVATTARGKETSSIGFGKLKSPELTRNGWRNLVIATAATIGTPVALDAISPDIGMSAGYYTSLPVRGLIEGAQIAGSVVTKGENLSSGADYKLFLANNDSEFKAKLLKLGKDYSETGNGMDYQKFIETHPEYKDALPADVEAGLNLQKKLIIDPATQRAEATRAQSEILTQDSNKLAADRGKAAQEGLNSLVTSNGSESNVNANSPESITEEFNIAQFAGNLKALGFKGPEIDTVISAYNNAAVGDGFNANDVNDAQKLRTGLATIPAERRDVVLQSLGVAPAAP